MSTNTPTPRTDAAEYDSQPGNPMCPNGNFVVKSDVARQLERSLAAANERVRELEAEVEFLKDPPTA